MPQHFTRHIDEHFRDVPVDDAGVVQNEGIDKSVRSKVVNEILSRPGQQFVFNKEARNLKGELQP